MLFPGPLRAVCATHCQSERSWKLDNSTNQNVEYSTKRVSSTRRYVGRIAWAALQVAVVDELEVGLGLEPSAELGRDERVDLFGAVLGERGRTQNELV